MHNNSFKHCAEHDNSLIVNELKQVPFPYQDNSATYNGFQQG